MSLPTLLHKRDGRVVPFQPDKIARSLFAVTQTLGKPDAFLTHELTDGILHFLSLEAGEKPPSSDDVADLIIKVVRELGHPLIAKHYEESRGHVLKPVPAAAGETALLSQKFPIIDDHPIARAAFVDYSLRHVYPPDLVAAHRDGILELLDLHHPPVISAAVLHPNGPLPLDGWDLFEALREHRRLAGWNIAIDGLEHSLALHPDPSNTLLDRYLRGLQRGVEINGYRVQINLNSEIPPAWASSQTGPLFPEPTPSSARTPSDVVADRIVEEFRPDATATLNWHLSGRDLAPEAGPRLERVIARALYHPGIEFVFDRPGRPINLGPGLQRGGAGVLSRVRLNLNRFVDMLGGGPITSDVYLKKLASLARLAQSVAQVRRDYLTKLGSPLLHSGFLLERAILLVVYQGLIPATMAALGPSADEKSIIELAGKSLAAIESSLQSDQSRPLSTRLEWAFINEHSPDGEQSIFEGLGEGNQLWQRQLRHASDLGAIDGNGILAISWNRDEPGGVQQVAETLRAAWKSNVTRVRLGRFEPVQSG